MLHIVGSALGLQSCISTVREEDSVLFIGNGVYAATTVESAQCFAMQEDLDARGIDLPARVTATDYDGFLKLVVAHSNSVTWK